MGDTRLYFEKLARLNNEQGEKIWMCGEQSRVKHLYI